MTYKAIGSVRYARGPSLLSAFLLLTLNKVLSASVLEKPDVAVNRTRLIDDSGISRRNVTAVEERISVVVADSRASKLLQASLPEKSGFESARKVDPFTGWNITAKSGNGSTVVRLVHSPPANRSEKNSTSYRDAFLSSRRFVTGNRHKYPSHYSTILYNGEDRLQQDKRKSYATSEEYDHRVHNYASEYYPPHTQDYEESYNTIPEDQNNSGYDVPVTPGYDPWRVAYVPQDPGYFGPPITGDPVIIQKDPPPTIARECNCPSTTRSYECDSPGSSFLSLATALGQNLWALVKLIATSSVPFLIPLLALKIIIVPLKIFKFLALVKLFLKLFIILPFFVRVVYPALSGSFNLHSFLFQKIQDALPDDNSHHPSLHQHPHDAESRQEANHTSSAFGGDDRLLVEEENMWDLRACPSRVACEMGVFLGGAGHVSFPRNVASYLSRRADRALKGRSKKDEDEGEEEEDEEVQRDAVFKAFLVALGKRWTQDKCQVYNCAVLF